MLKQRGLAAAGVCLALLVGACESKETKVAVSDPAAPSAPAADERFTYAAIYECADGREVQVVFNHGDTSAILLRVGGSEPVTLAMAPDGNAPTWTDGTHTFTDMGGEATYRDGANAAVSCRGAARSLPPPKAPGVVRDITEAEAGATVSLKVGETFSISLSDVPTAGYAWSAINPPAFLKAGDELGGATTTAQFLPGYAGGNHWIVLTFEATAAGEGDLELVQKRPWQDEPDPDDKRFKVHVSAK